MKGFKSQNIQQLDLLIKNIKKEIKNEGWFWHIVNLSWTAGPVTGIAVFAGYYVSYGKFTSIKTIIYFGIYTILAGLFAIMFQAFKNAAINPQIEQYKYQLHYLIDRYLEYTTFCKEYLVYSFPKEQRPLMSAWWVLTSASSDIDMIQHAVFLVTGKSELVKAIQKIEFFRKQGFTQQLQQEYENIESQLNKSLEKIEPNFPSLAKALKQRFQGKIQNAKLGLERPHGFLSRLMSLANDDNEYNDKYIRIDDIIALFNLVIELILNRKILILHPEFKSNKELEKLINEYETKISNFKLIRRQRNSQAKEMIEAINEHFKGKEFTSLGANSGQLNDILEEIKSSFKYKGVLKKKNIKSYILNINQKNKVLKIILNRLRLIYSKKLAKTNFQDLDVGIKESFIYLEEPQKIKIVKQLTKIIEKHEENEISIDTIKKICFEVINVLDEKLKISEHDRQIAIEESMAVDLNILEPNSPTTYKIGIIVNQINELQHTKTKIIHRFVKHLAQYYNFKISDKLKQKVINEYQAEKECLDKIDEKDENIDFVSLDNLEKEIFTVTI